MNSVNLQDIPDPQMLSFEALMAWIEERLAILRTVKFTPEVASTFTPYELHETFTHACGAEASANWRRFFIAILLADWACHPEPSDRVDYSRLKYIMTSAYHGMRLWCCRAPDGKITPVGYTGWYPISRFLYQGICADPSGISDRGLFMPDRVTKPEDVEHLYAFNISIIPSLQNTPCSRQIVRSYLHDAMRFKDAKVMAVTVDAAGKKLAKLTTLKRIARVECRDPVKGDLLVYR